MRSSLPALPQRLPRRRLDPDQRESDRDLLRNIQGNIVRAHGRKRGLLIFFRLGTDADANRAALASAAEHVTSAEQQRLDARSHQTARTRGAFSSRAPFASVALSAAGLRACGCAEEDFPPGHNRHAAAFAGGMARDHTLLGDPPPATWDEPFRSPMHGVWLVAAASTVVLHGLLEGVREWLAPAGGAIARVEPYFHWRPVPAARWACREPFGFADGISNAEFFANAAPNHWSIDLSLDRVLIDDATSHHGGSFLVIRKLEQNVAAFRAFEEKLAAAFRSALPAARATEAARLAEAVIVGRDREGIPLVGLESDNLNDFTFRGDAQAARCPFHAHIRKANPRDDDPYGAAIAPEDARQFQFVRRSFVYGDPARLTLEGPDWPEGGVGLWFMGYMRDIEEQFREMQARWMRDPRFPAHQNDALPDPLLFGGEFPGVDAATTWAWNREGRSACVAGLSRFVHPRGGEYFYVPPLRWLSAGGPEQPSTWVEHSFADSAPVA